MAFKGFRFILFSLKEKYVLPMQKVRTHIGRFRMKRQIWVCTAWLCPFYEILSIDVLVFTITIAEGENIISQNEIYIYYKL